MSTVLAPSPDHEFELVEVQPGLHSLRSRPFRETFHPVVGPMVEAEALHVRQQRLRERAKEATGTFVVWDVGLGAAANAIAALNALRDVETQVEIHSFDCSLAALEFATSQAERLPYVKAHRSTFESLLEHGNTREGSVEWSIHIGDFRDTLNATAAALPHPHAILYDPYSPKANPELWELEHFRRLHAALDPARPCLLSNYSRSTAVRVTLLLAGFCVGFGAATGEKDQTTLASNDPGLLTTPLDRTWLGRVSRSVRSAPLRAGATDLVISEDDYAALEAHPQFR